MSNEIDEKLYNEAMQISSDLSQRFMNYLGTEVKKINPAILQLDTDRDYFFTLHLLGTFIKDMAYSLEIYHLMQNKSFPSEKVVEIVKSIALSLMENKKNDFQQIANNMIKQVKDKPNVANL